MTLTKVQDFLKGKKTYITAAIDVLGAVAAWADGQTGGAGLLAALWAAAQTCFIRAGISTSAERAEGVEGK